MELSERTKELLDQHFSDRLKLGRDMQGMGVSRKHLTQVFRQKFESPADAGLSNRSIGAEAPAAAFGKTASADFASAGYKYDITPSEYLIQVRIAAARQLLQEGSDIPDAAGAAGYENLSEFYDHFRRQTGMTPARYRQIFADNISRSVLDTPIGPLRMIASQDAILCVEQAGRESLDAGESADEIPADRIIAGDSSGELVKDCEAQLGEYFAGKRRTFDLSLSPEGTDFQKNVWKHLRDIPYGETRTYGELAAMTGNEKASRAVGMVNHCNPILILVPCHRVIGADGSLTGYAAGIEAKKYLLTMEKRYSK